MQNAKRRRMRKHLLHGSVGRCFREHAACPAVVIPAPAPGDAHRP